jgi:hypothetical protein
VAQRGWLWPGICLVGSRNGSSGSGARGCTVALLLELLLAALLHWGRDRRTWAVHPAIAAARHGSSQAYPGGTCQAGYLSGGREQRGAGEQLAAILTKVPAGHDMWFARLDWAGLAY